MALLLQNKDIKDFKIIHLDFITALIHVLGIKTANNVGGNIFYSYTPNTKL
jgi:hypothetical protein